MDGSAVAATATNDAGYVAMEDTTPDVVIAAIVGGGNSVDDKIDCVVLFNKELSATEVADLYNSGNGTENLVSIGVNQIGFGGYGLTNSKSMNLGRRR